MVLALGVNHEAIELGPLRLLARRILNEPRLRAPFHERGLEARRGAARVCEQHRQGIRARSGISAQSLRFRRYAVLPLHRVEQVCQLAAPSRVERRLGYWAQAKAAQPQSGLTGRVEEIDVRDDLTVRARLMAKPEMGTASLPGALEIAKLLDRDRQVDSLARQQRPHDLDRGVEQCRVNCIFTLGGQIRGVQPESSTNLTFGWPDRPNAAKRRAILKAPLASSLVRSLHIAFAQQSALRLFERPAKLSGGRRVIAIQRQCALCVQLPDRFVVACRSARDANAIAAAHQRFEHRADHARAILQAERCSHAQIRQGDAPGTAQGSRGGEHELEVPGNWENHVVEDAMTLQVAWARRGDRGFESQGRARLAVRDQRPKQRMRLSARRHASRSPAHIPVTTTFECVSRQAHLPAPFTIV